MMFSFMHRKATWYQILLLCALACAVRTAVFMLYIQHNERFCQSDSMDYHIAALCIKHGYGMTRPDTQQPIFWRTPGYPWYLSHFYDRLRTSDFSSHKECLLRALWAQIIICSLLPVICYSLAITLTHHIFIAWLASIISVFHTGFVLASTYLLTDALGQILFLLFLLFFFKSFVLFKEKKINTDRYSSIIAAALLLGLYSWLRPMGQFVALFCIFLLLLSRDSGKRIFIKITLFFFTFAAVVAPWFYRNYQLTGKLFFCPLFGLYFNVFNAPKILSRIENIPLIDAHKQLTQAAGRLTAQEMYNRQRFNKKEVVCGELVCLKTAWPLIASHPFYFMYDWCVEVAKTTFDLYAWQLVALHNNCFKWDPLIEYLPEKIEECLYKKELPFFFRMLAYLELFFSIVMWVGIFVGIWIFLIGAFFTNNQTIQNYAALWFKCGILIGAVVFQTGGFGYARLRLPIEPLIIILGTSFWYYKKRGE